MSITRPDQTETQNIASLPDGNTSPPCENAPPTRPGQTETQNIASLPRDGQKPPHQFNKFGPQSQNLASIVRGYKIGVTKFARQQKLDFAWQDRYHDHIIRNVDEWQRINEYIWDNPARWAADRFNKNNDPG